MKQPTPRQLQVHKFMVRYVLDNGYPPTMREIADGIGWSATSMAFQMMYAMERKGLVAKLGTSANGKGINRCWMPMVDGEMAIRLKQAPSRFKFIEPVRCDCGRVYFGLSCPGHEWEEREPRR